MEAVHLEMEFAVPAVREQPFLLRRHIAGGVDRGEILREDDPAFELRWRGDLLPVKSIIPPVTNKRANDRSSRRRRRHSHFRCIADLLETHLHDQVASGLPTCERMRPLPLCATLARRCSTNSVVDPVGDRQPCRPRTARRPVVWSLGSSQSDGPRTRCRHAGIAHIDTEMAIEKLKANRWRRAHGRARHRPASRRRRSCRRRRSFEWSVPVHRSRCWWVCEMASKEAGLPCASVNASATRPSEKRCGFSRSQVKAGCCAASAKLFIHA